MSHKSGKKLLSALKAAAWGAACFGGIYIFTMLANYLFGWHSTEGPDVSGVVVSVIPEFVRDVTGWGKHPGSAFTAYVFEAIVNGIAGASFFFALALFWQFVVRREYEHGS